VFINPAMAEGKVHGDAGKAEEKTVAAEDKDARADAREQDDDEESRRWSRRRPQLDEQQMAGAVEVLKAMRPDLAERISLAMAENPERVREMVMREYPRLRYMIALKRRDPKMFDLRAEDIRLAYQSQQLAEDIRKLDQAENVERREAAQAQLAQLLKEHYEVRHRLRELEIVRLEQRLEQLREELDERAARREAIIRQRLQELLKEEKD